MREQAEEVATGLIIELGAATLELGRAKEARVDLLIELDAMRPGRDETRDDAEGVTLASRTLNGPWRRLRLRPPAYVYRSSMLRLPFDNFLTRSHALQKRHQGYRSNLAPQKLKWLLFEIR
ncbi:hypothetical protein ACLOJK_038485 [Asimina triloba]